LVCTGCELEEVEVPTDTRSVLCGICVQQLVGGPPKPKPKLDRPRGWHLKTYIEFDGVVYSKGVAITDPAEIKVLRTAATAAGIGTTSTKVPKSSKPVTKAPAKKPVRGKKPKTRRTR
jgi:hypothetical protein